MAELPNAVSYVIIAALIVSGVSLVVAWQPFNRVTALAVAPLAECDQAACDLYDLNFCDGQRLRHADYSCQAGECRLVEDRMLAYCDFSCVEPEHGQAHCTVRRFN